MHEIVFDNTGYGHRIAKAAGSNFNPAADRCIARVKDGILLGGVVYVNYSIASISAHVCGFVDNWMNRDLLWVLFDYPFVQLGCDKIIVQIPETNIKSLEFATNLGFNLETKVIDVFPNGGALLVLGMYRRDCRWLKIKPRFLKAGEHG